MHSLVSYRAGIEPGSVQVIGAWKLMNYKLFLVLGLVLLNTPALAQEIELKPCIEMAKQVRVGMTRSAVKAILGEAAGLSSPSESTYNVGHCKEPTRSKIVLLRVKFSVSRDGLKPNEPIPFRDTDIVSEVSEPEIGLGIVD
jgi:hypothetical protein